MEPATVEPATVRTGSSGGGTGSIPCAAKTAGAGAGAGTGGLSWVSTRFASPWSSLRSPANREKLKKQRSFSLNKAGLAFIVTDDFHRYHYVVSSPVRTQIALAVLGCLGGLAALTVDMVVKLLTKLRVETCTASDEPLQRYASFCTTGAVLALAAGLLVMLCPDAAGSGLPEVKQALSGLVIPSSFAWKVLLAKPFALAFAVSASLSIGKEGPLVHTSCCIAQLLCEAYGCFGFQRERVDQRRQELMIAACAVGVVLTFGAPIGGVLFSIEITSSYYVLDNLPQAFLSASLGLVVVNHLAKPVINYFFAGIPSATGDALFATAFPFSQISLIELVVFVLQGVVVAALATLLIKAVRFTGRCRPLLARWRLTALMAGSVACSATYLSLAGGQCNHPMLDSAKMIMHVFNADPVPRGAFSAAEQQGIATLLCFSFAKMLLLTPISLNLSSPTGVFLPAFVCGATLGRAIGEVLCHMLPSLLTNSLPGHFAVASAAAMTTVATRTMSVAVITLEMTGQLTLGLPILVCCTTSYYVAQRLDTPSLFDVFMAMKGLPGSSLSGIPFAASGPIGRSRLTVAKAAETLDFFRLETAYVTRHMTRASLKRFVKAESHNMSYSGMNFVPIVASDVDHSLVGCVHRDALDDIWRDQLQLQKLMQNSPGPISSSRRSASANDLTEPLLPSNYVEDPPLKTAEETEDIDIVHDHMGLVRNGVDLAPLAMYTSTRCMPRLHKQSVTSLHAPTSPSCLALLASTYHLLS